MATAELFHTPGGHDSEGYATVIVGDHHETWPVSSKGFRWWLCRQYYQQFDKAVGSQAVQDALGVIAGEAVYDGPEYQVYVRMAEHDGKIFLDLANDDGQAIEISVTGWRIVTDPPVKFIRKRGMLPLPTPVRGGQIDDLRELVNVPDDDAWMLAKGWLVATLRLGRPFPVLVVNGEQGSAKSTFCKFVRALIDPNGAPLRRPPRNDLDLVIAATNGWIVAYDNLSSISVSLSDCLCTLATGGGFGTRQLYTDDEEKLFDAMRPVLVNGIDDTVTRDDLLDRSIVLTLPTIADDQRLDEDKLWSKFNELKPSILGALLDAVSTALERYPSIKLHRAPRMADFAKWIVAAAPALGFEADDFLVAYDHNRTASTTAVIESMAIGPAINGLMDGCERWHGVLRELLVELESHHSDEKTRGRKDWPKSPRKLSGDLRRLAPSLRKLGIDVTFHEHTKNGTPITLEQVCETPSPSSPSSLSGSLRGEDTASGAGYGDGADDVLQPHSKDGCSVKSANWGEV